jgi:hypothetical protein
MPPSLFGLYTSRAKTHMYTSRAKTHMLVTDLH